MDYRETSEIKHVPYLQKQMLPNGLGLSKQELKAGEKLHFLLTGSPFPIEDSDMLSSSAPAVLLLCTMLSNIFSSSVDSTRV